MRNHWWGSHSPTGGGHPLDGDLAAPSSTSEMRGRAGVWTGGAGFAAGGRDQRQLKLPAVDGCRSWRHGSTAFGVSDPGSKVDSLNAVAAAGQEENEIGLSPAARRSRNR